MYDYDHNELRGKRIERIKKYTVLTPSEVMDILNIGKNTMYTLLNSGKFSAFRVGRSWRIAASALEEFMLEEHII